MELLIDPVEINFFDIEPYKVFETIIAVSNLSANNLDL